MKIGKEEKERREGTYNVDLKISKHFSLPSSKTVIACSL